MAERITKSGAVIDDRRTDEDRKNTAYYVVCTDSFMSGWGQAPGKSYFAIPCESHSEAQIVANNAHRRSEMKRVRIVHAKEYRPKLRKGDHLSIRDRDGCSRWYQPGGF